MANENREWVWLQCTSCDDLNYRTNIKVAVGVQKVELKKYCTRERKHTQHKTKRKYADVEAVLQAIYQHSHGREDA